MTTWWDAGWSCRKSISVTTTVNSYILPITVKATSGYDGTPANTVYGNGWCSTNYADIRFVAQPDAGGDVLLNHWIETIGADQAYIWVKLSSSIDALGKIWMYYGNSTAAAVSNPSNTFVNVIGSLVGAWHCDEGTGSTTADTSGFGHHGTLNGGVLWTAAGTFGTYATTNNGNARYILLGTSLFGDTTISASLWFKQPTSISGTPDGRIITTGTVITTGTENTNKWMMSMSGPDNRIVFTNTSASHATPITGSNTKDAIWHHYVGITKPTESLYLDSVLQTSTRTDSWSFEANMKIGSRGTSYGMVGCVDDILIFNKTLSTVEIADIYGNYSYTTLNYPGYALVKPYNSSPPTWGTVYKEEPKSFSDTISLTDTHTTASHFQRTLSDIISPSDVRAYSATLMRELADAASMGDTLTEERRYEYFTGDTDVSVEMYGSNWRGQTFTVGTVEDNHTHSLTKVRLKLVRGGTPGDVIASVRNTSGGYPTGPDLTSCTIDANGITTDLGGQWIDFPLPSYQLTAGVKYAICVRAPTGDISNFLRVRRINSDAYAGGGSIISTISGDTGTWGPDGTKDVAFEEWGLQVGYSTPQILAETLGLLDALTSQRRYTRTISDTVTDQDTLAPSAIYQRSYDETISLADTWSYGKFIEYILSDTITFIYGDSNLFPFTFPITFSSGVSSELNFSLNKAPFTESISFDDMLLTPGRYTQLCLDTITVIDTFSRIGVFTRTLSENVTDTDVLTRTQKLYRTTADTITLSDVPTKGATKLFTDILNLTDIRTYAASYGRTLSDTVTESDTKTIRLAKVISESVSTSDTKTPSTGKLATDLISITDLVTKSGVWYRTFTESLPLDDVLESSFHGATQYIKNLTETLTLSDILTTASHLNRSLTEVLSISDTATRNTAYQKILAETAVLSDVFARVAKLFRTPQDTISLTDVWARGIIQSISVSDIIGMTDTFTSAAVFQRTLSESATLEDTVDRAIRYTRELADQLGIADTWERIASYNRVLLEPLTLADTYSSFIWWISEGGGDAHISLTRIGSTQWIWNRMGLTNMDLDSVGTSDSSMGQIGHANITNHSVGQVQISFS
jgi:hypothetical protein